MKRKLLYGLTLLLASSSVIGLAACGKKDKTTTAEEGCKDMTPEQLVKDVTSLEVKKTTIKLYADNGDPYKDELIAEFEKANPQYIIDYSTVGATDVRARMELEGEDGADVFVMPHDHVGAALATNLLAKVPGELKTTFQSTLKASTLATITSCWDDAKGTQKACGETDTPELFGAPLSAESLALFYDVNLIKDILTNKGGAYFAADAVPADTLTKWANWAAELNETNLTQLMTLEDMLEVGTYYNIVGSDDARYFYQADFDDFYHSYMYLTPFGYEIFGPNGDDKTLDNLASDEVKAAYSYMQEIFKTVGENQIYPGADGIVQGTYMDNFYAKNGKAPIVVTGPWNASAIKDAFADEDADGNTVYPGLGGSGMPAVMVNGVKTATTTFSGVQVIGVSKYSKQTAAAWNLVKFMVSEKGADILYSNSGKLPCLQDVSNVEGLADDPVLNAVSAQLTNSKGMPSITEMGYMWTIGTELFKDLFAGKDVTVSTNKAHESYVSQAKIGA